MTVEKMEMPIVRQHRRERRRSCAGDGEAGRRTGMKREILFIHRLRGVRSHA
jgi:hypothetical protein